MKRTVNINLGGHPVIIDEDAYQILSQYLKQIEDQFKDASGGDEILHDIETRIAELFGEYLNGAQIVNKGHVEKVIQTMGKPHSFDDQFDPIFEETEESMKGEYTMDEGFDRTYSTGKRFFRDPHSKVLGGVASGMAAYLGIKDPVWVRLAFVLFTFAGVGASILVYILLWIIVPEAKSASDRLAMRGEPINISSIADDIEKEAMEWSDKIQDFGDKMKEKRRKKKAEKEKL